MPNARYTLQIDWDDDGDFDQPEEDLGRAVIAARWALGLDDPDAAVATPSWTEAILRDGAGRYAPENSDGPLYGLLTPQRKARLTATFDGATRTLFTGWTESFAPRPDGTTVLRLGGVEALLRRAEVFLPPETDQTADLVIDAALRQVAYPPALSGYWVLGRARLGLNTRLADVSFYRDLEAGVSRFPYVGDNWAEGVSAWAAIRAVSEAERGLCFVDRAGKLIFWNRHHLLKAVTVAASFDERSAAFAVVAVGAGMVNHAVVTCHPREVGAAPEALWTLQTPLELPPGQARTVRARFTDESGTPIGGLNVITPVAGTDFHANTAPDGSGQDFTGSVTASLVAAASSAAVTFASGAARTVYILAGAQVRGIRLADRGALDVEAEDGLSVADYGRRILGLDLPLLTDPEEADRLARFVVLLGSIPRGQIERITVGGAERLADVLSLTVGSRIALSDARSGHARDYHIVGEQHHLERGGAVHEVTWVLRPASPIAFWRLGVAGAGELGAATRIAY